jgi:phage terminase large subunit-like protein
VTSGRIQAPHPLEFFGELLWLDGRPLMDVIEPYRRRLFSEALYTFREDGTPLYNLVVRGVAKKNWKSADLILAGTYRFLVWPSVAGNDCLLLANDEDQAGDDLEILKKLIAVNPILQREVEVRAKEILRRDGRGTFKILPARDVLGTHGKTALFIGFDEIHGWKTWDLPEALAPDPTRPDVITWITSYDTIYNVPGVPLHDLKRMGLAGEDPRMLFSWYSADVCTDPEFADLPPEERANPSMGSWPEGRAYLEQQRRRLPSNKFRRLHLNLPGAPSGAFFDAAALEACVVKGRRRLSPAEGTRYFGYVDMSGGSSDDATVAVAHRDKSSGRAVLDVVAQQAGGIPFNPRDAVRKFVGILKEYGVRSVTGDAYAGQTFRADFESAGVRYVVSQSTTSDLYEALEPKINAGEVELLDQPKLLEQLLTLVVRGARVTHQSGDHDDWATSASGALVGVAQPVCMPGLFGVGGPVRRTREDFVNARDI